MKIDKTIIDNPLFYKWVYNPDKVIEKYWTDYLSKHPENKELLLEFKKKFERISISDEKLSRTHKKVIAQRIMGNTIRKERTSLRKTNFSHFLRYAAIAVLFFSMGSIIVYFTMQDKLHDLQISELQNIPQVNGPTLVLSKGNNINLQEKESSIDYSQEGKIVLNENKILSSQEKIAADNSINQLIIPYGNRSRIKLSDNTIAWLNAGSRLVYPSEFEENKREVLLFGEAFFEVSKDTERPFIVKTTDLTIKVLGTKFNICAYPDDNVIQTVLTEGKISLRRNDANLFEDDLIVYPKQMVWFSKKSNRARVTMVDPTFYTLWKDGLIKFSDQDLSRVIKQVERFYNISFLFENPLDGNIKISGKLDLNEDQDEVLNYISKVALVEIHKNKKNKYVIK